MDELLVVQVMGVDLHLVTSGSQTQVLDHEIRDAWARCITPDAPRSEEPVTLEVCLDEDAAVVTEARARGAVAATDLVALMDQLSTKVTQLGLEQRVGSAWLLHACALVHPDTGATVLLVAPSGTGKTTAAKTLGRQFGYLTDETAVVELDGSMTPFPKPLSLLIDGQRPKRQVAPQDLDLVPVTVPAHLAAVAVLQRDPEAVGVTVEAVPMVEALALLAEQTSSLHLLESPLQTVADLLHARGGLRRLIYSESADLVSVVAQWMEEEQ